MMTETKKQYQTPLMKAIGVQQMQMICFSKGSFGVSNGGQIEEGDESDWADVNLNW